MFTKPILRELGISTRNDLGHWLVEHGLTERGVEVGTHLGEYAEILLKTWPGHLYCVDPYEAAPDFEDQSQWLWGPKYREAWEAATARLTPYGKCTLHKMTSQQAAQYMQAIPDLRFDFVYLDGNHEEPYVTQDINLWWNLLKPGGVLCGHDFISPSPDESPEYWPKWIQPAVFTFCAQNSIDTIYLIPEPDRLPWSYAIRKPA